MMKIDHDQLRLLYQRHVASGRPPDRHHCPSSWAMAGAFDTSLSIRMKRRIADHISDCRYCREEFQMLLEAQRAGLSTGKDEERADLNTTSTRPTRMNWHYAFPRFWRYASVLIGLCLAISSVFFIIQQDSRSGVPRANVAALQLMSPKADQILTFPPVFRWQKSPACRTYILEIFDELMLPFWSSGEIEYSEVSLPLEVSRRLVPGKSYFWMVTGFTPDLETKESSLSRFTLRK
jgi:hypothetical protein